MLSACETGLAEHGSGDEMVGLVRAFLVAGAARVLASLWPVDDAVTADFMASFYGALLRRQSPGGALQQAQSRRRCESTRTRSIGRLSPCTAAGRQAGCMPSDC